MEQTDRRWKVFFVTFLLSVPAVMLTLVMIGHVLPSPYSRYVPLVDPIVRTEKVLTSTAKLGQAPCVAFFGDSRVAFSVNSIAAFPKCASKNYGFPALGPREMAYLMDRVFQGSKAKVAVISMSLNFYFEGYDGFDDDQYGLGLSQKLYTHTALRWLYLGLKRTQVFVAAHRGKVSLGDPWLFSSNLGRWTQQPRFEGAIAARLPTLNARVVAIAERYYGGKSASDIDVDRVVTVLARRGARIADEVVFLIPPQMSQFTDVEAEALPGGRAEFLRKVTSAAEAAGASVLDCVEPRSCGLDDFAFADPVHLNGDGAKKFSNYLAARFTPSD